MAEIRKSADFREIVLLTIISDWYSPQVRGQIEKELKKKIKEYRATKQKNDQIKRG